MKNKEKFAKEILDIVCTGDDVAIDKDTMKLQACDAQCSFCYFCIENYPDIKSKRCCRDSFVHWANSEYKEKKEFSEADKALVKGLDKLNWFARDEIGGVWGFVDRPFKSKYYWLSDGDYSWVTRYSSATFEPLSWEDEEPVHRSEILK